MKPSRFLLRVWRWHFYAGLFALPFLFILASTGIVYLFRAELDEIIYRNSIFVKPVSNPLLLEEQKKLAQSALPNAQLKNVKPPFAPDRSTAFLFVQEGHSERTVYVHPETGDVLGTREEDFQPAALALKLHGELFLGQMGDLIMELAASWSVLLVVSGVYLWFPRTRKLTLWGVLLPRLRPTQNRTRMRDLHSVSGFWVSGILVFFAITGLFWSSIWGNQLVKPWNTFPAKLWNQVPNSEILTSSLNSSAEKVAPWAVESLPLPESESEHGHHGNHSEPARTDSGNKKIDTPVDLDFVQKLATEKALYVNRTLSMPQGDKGVYSVSANALAAEDEATLHINQYTGEVLADIRFNDYSMAAKGVAISIALHEGRYFGFWNKMLALAGCILVILLTVSAAILWWRRRPRLSTLAAPSRVELPQFWKGAALLVCLFSVIFPVAGLSLLLVFCIDYLIVQRIPLLKRAF